MLRGYRINALTGVTRQTLAFIWRHKASYIIFLAVAFCTYTTLEVIYSERLIPPGDGGFQGINFLWSTTSMVATAIATAIFATPLHNFIIKNEKSYFPKYPARVLLFASLEFIPSLFFALFDASLAEPYRMGHIFLRGVLFFVAGFTASVFLTTILPYVAITPIRNLSIRKAMKLSRGYRWSIFAKLFGLSIIFTLFVVIVALLSVFTPWTLPSGDAGTSYYALKIAGGLVYSMMALLFVTLASLIYRRLSDVVETASSPASAEI